MNAVARVPAHLWVVGALAALWNGFGALDYSMTQMRNPTWMAQLTSEQIAWLENAPPWMDASWAFGVWGGLAGSLLLLARSRHAVPAFILSLAGLAANTLSQLALTTPSPHLDSGADLGLHAAIWIAAIGLLVYASRMRARKVLR